MRRQHFHLELPNAKGLRVVVYNKEIFKPTLSWKVTFQIFRTEQSYVSSFETKVSPIVSNGAFSWANVDWLAALENYSKFIRLA